MKKLMTMLSAVALAFGVQAADPWYSGTSFESMTPETSLDLTSGEGLMWQTNGAPTLTIKGISGAYDQGTRASYFQSHEATRNNALSVKTTFGQPVFRTNTVETMGSGIYVDTYIKPTICEDDNITLDSSAKLAIWFKLDDPDNPTATNLMITAGYYTGSGFVTTNYDCGPVVGDAEAWQRFTVKSFSDITSDHGGVPGFVVFRNGVAVPCAESKFATDLDLETQAALYNKYGLLFPSAVQSGDAKTTISAIGFDGTGLVDDILFTDDEPAFAAPYKTFTLAWDDHVTRFAYKVGTKAVVTNDNLNASGSIVVDVDGDVDVVISAVTVEQGYVVGALTKSGDGISVSGDAFSVVPANFANNPTGMINSMNPTVTVTIGDKETVYGNLADAFDYVNNEGTGAVTMQLTAGQTLTSAITLDGANLTGVTIDLNGQTITYSGEGYAITAAVPLRITDSSTGGGITATQVVTSSVGLTIDAGTFSGAVTVTDGTAAVSGGTFNGATTLVAGCVTGGTFANNPTSYLAPGYGYEVVAEKYVVGIATYEISYADSDGLSALTATPVSYQIGDTLSPTAPSETKTGYTFAGWTWYDVTDQDNPQPVEYVAGTTACPLALIASWSADTYTITLNANGGSVSPASTNYTVETAAFDLPIPTLADNTFAGWTNETFTTPFTNFSPANVVAPANFTLFAKWVPNAAPVEPVAPGTTDITPPAGKSAADYADQINKDKPTYISVPADASSDYLDLFKAAASGETVQIVFDEASPAYTDLTNKVEAAVTAIPVATVAGKAAEDITEVVVPADNVKAGLWYSISSGSALGSMTEGNRTQATSSGVTLTAPTYSGSGFYKVLVNPKNK